MTSRCAFAIAAIVLAACRGAETGQATSPASRPSILLVTLDTTRADAIGPDTPSFNELAARGIRFQWAYATSPQTLPSHTSMMSGLYPAAHGIHENGRYPSDQHPYLAQKLSRAGYRTAAFVSAFTLARSFGLARGFDVYDDDFKGGIERSAPDTTDRALEWLNQQPADRPEFLWVHYFDPHHPYVPSYREEVASMDRELGRLVRAFEARNSPAAIVVAADHGEGLGEHGEAQHGHLLYQATMHVPLLIVGPGIAPGISEQAVSTRRVFHTVLHWAGLGTEHSLRTTESETVVGEAMMPFLQYGWRPQVMAIAGTQKTILAGATETYDVAADPGESKDISKTASLSREVRQALREYPIPSPWTALTQRDLSDEDRKKLASLGYVTGTTRPVLREDAPRPRDMAHLFEPLEAASALFTAARYRESIPLFERILASDPYNVSVVLRLAVAHSSIGNNDAALENFRKARQLAPQSQDVRHYLGLHHARLKQYELAAPLLEQVLAESPDRVPAAEALAAIYEGQGRQNDAFRLRRRILASKTPSAAELLHLGRLAMSLGQTEFALDAYQKAKRLQGQDFQNHLELGVLYLAAGRLDEARQALDQVGSSHRDYPMALFKRAQVSVLLRENDAPSRIEMARRNATPLTRELIARERLFQNQN